MTGGSDHAPVLHLSLVTFALLDACLCGASLGSPGDDGRRGMESGFTVTLGGYPRSANAQPTTRRVAMAEEDPPAEPGLYLRPSDS